MAQLQHIQLTVSKTAASPNAQRAEVQFEVRFSDNELSANQRYLVQAHLFEKDDKRDFFVMKPDGKIMRDHRDNNDNSVGFIQDLWIQPNNRSVVPVTLKREWVFGELDDNLFDSSTEAFYATVTVVPELARGDWEVSPEVNLDIG